MSGPACKWTLTTALQSASQPIQTEHWSHQLAAAAEASQCCAWVGRTWRLQQTLITEPSNRQPGSTQAQHWRLLGAAADPTGLAWVFCQQIGACSSDPHYCKLQSASQPTQANLLPCSSCMAQVGLQCSGQRLNQLAVVTLTTASSNLPASNTGGQPGPCSSCIAQLGLQCSASRTSLEGRPSLLPSNAASQPTAGRTLEAVGYSSWWPRLASSVLASRLELAVVTLTTASSNLPGQPTGGQPEPSAAAWPRLASSGLAGHQRAACNWPSLLQAAICQPAHSGQTCCHQQLHSDGIQCCASRTSCLAIGPPLLRVQSPASQLQAQHWRLLGAAADGNRSGLSVLPGRLELAVVTLTTASSNLPASPLRPTCCHQQLHPTFCVSRTSLQYRPTTALQQPASQPRPTWVIKNFTKKPPVFCEHN